MKTNISILNAIMRITCGLTAVAWATSRMARRPGRLAFLFVAMMGAMKVAEGIFRYCPTKDLLKSCGIKDTVLGKEQKDEDLD